MNLHILSRLSAEFSTFSAFSLSSDSFLPSGKSKSNYVVMTIMLNITLTKQITFVFAQANTNLGEFERI